MARRTLSSINLNLLVALEALLSTRSVSEAARRVSVTTSAMSHSLAALRALFDEPLLVRSGGRMALTPYAESLCEPLARALGGITRILDGATRFDPASARRRFVIAAPDFFSTLILPELVAIVARDAPGIELSIVPSVRRGNAWLLESGELDLALGAVVDDAPGIRRLELCTESFACAVRKGHPDVAGRLSLDLYARLPHLVITLGDDERPTWIDEALARKGRSRRVALRTRYFMAAPLIVAASDLVLTAPAMLVGYFAKLVPLTVLAPPLRLPSYPEEAYWHERYDSDHAAPREPRTAAARAAGSVQPELPRHGHPPLRGGRLHRVDVRARRGTPATATRRRLLLNLGQGHSAAGLLLAFGGFAVLPVVLGARALRSKERPELEARARTAWDAELLRLAAARDGSLTVTEVMAHADLDAESAERYLADLCRRGMADPRVTEDGQVVYHFEPAPTREQKRDAKGVLDD